MIILLDIEKQRLSLYKKDGLVQIPFSQAGEIYDYIEDDTVLYITNAIEVNATDILNMIKRMGISVGEDNIQDSDNKYLHGIGDGTIYIDDTLKFEGKFDCKIIDQQMTQTIKANPILQDLIKNRKIEIIGEKIKRKLMQEFRKFNVRQLEKQKLIDKQLDNIILKTKVADWDGNVEDRTHEDAISIDVAATGKISAGGDIGPTFNTMSELLENIEGLE